MSPKYGDIEPSFLFLSIVFISFVYPYRLTHKTVSFPHIALCLLCDKGHQ